MASVVVRIPAETHAKLREIAEERHETVGQVITEMVEVAEEQSFWESFSESVSRTKRDPEAWRQIQEEQRLYDRALLDGLDDE